MNPLKRKKKTNNPESNETEIPVSASRITNETVAEHREKVLAGGRKFKYPVQYQKHKLVINTILIVVGALVIVSLLVWHQLYVASNSSKLMYRITQLLPVPVASVDNASVRYSDFLLRYRSSLFYLQKENDVNLGTADGKRQAEFVKRQELDKTELLAYVRKLARERGVTVSSEEIDAFIKRDVDARSVSLNAYEKTVLKHYYDWSLDEYRDVVRDELLKRKVSFAIDDPATEKVNKLRAAVQGGGDMSALARENSDDDVTKANGGDAGPISLQNQDANGLIAAAKNLEKGQLSEVIQGVDGYYFIQLIDKNDSAVHYRVIKVGLRALDAQFEALKKQDGKVREYISVESREE